MIAEAVDAALLLWRALWVWVVILAGVGTLAGLGAVAGVWWAVNAIRNGLSARLSDEAPEKAPALLRTPDRPAESRLRPRSTREPRPESPATGPSRPRSPRWSAPHGGRGGFPAPTRQRAPEARTGDPAPKEAA